MEKKHTCETCNKKFATPNSLSNHKRIYHSETRDSKTDSLEHVCDNCDKKYKTKLTLLRHTRKCVGTNRVITAVSDNDSDSDNESESSEFDISYTVDNRKVIPIDEHLTIMIKLKSHIIKLQKDLITSNAIIDKLIQCIQPRQQL